MIIISTKTESFFKNGLRRIKALMFGKSDNKTPYESAPFGTDGTPPDGWKAIVAPTSEKGKFVVLGYINKAQLESLNPGEKRIYSLDPNEEVSAFIYLQDDNTMQLNGEGDFVARYQPLEDSIQELQNDINDLKAKLSAWVPVPTDGGAALKTILADYFAQNINEDVTKAKISEIKTTPSQ